MTTEATRWPPAWPRSHDESLPAGDYRAVPEDFVVEECLGFSPEGEGEHLWLWVEKRTLTTHELARMLAQACGVRERDIGYAGMKDRQAVTRQWLSVHLPGREAPENLQAALEARLGTDEARVVCLLDQARHPRKLKRGVHRGNRFLLRLTGDVVEDPSLEARWRRLVEQGVPNYFGPQRFGPEGRNLARARALLVRGWRKRDDRQGMLLSAARSYLFNQLLAARIADGSWATPLPGELVMLEGSASQFLADDMDDVLRERAARLDVHPSGVLWGSGRLASQGQAAERERTVIATEPELAAGLEAAEVRMARRPLRLCLDAPRLRREAGALHLAFGLPRGAFATAVLRELMTNPTL
ncbi:tRNA pseudouridine(13) synthase TruD [Halomonas sp. YLGW01]|uniref:tRNA pseudouridine(13) synthase TruD n=1 Tax=Halomonas sp. YLGW01 TaxID=2773308 RepID=UPI0017800ED7|nr:tRNA pseudouridine(13) synthase TruD [Halomonas sp. YLGW01]